MKNHVGPHNFNQGSRTCKHAMLMKLLSLSDPHPDKYSDIVSGRPSGSVICIYIYTYGIYSDILSKLFSLAFYLACILKD